MVLFTGFWHNYNFTYYIFWCFQEAIVLLCRNITVNRVLECHSSFDTSFIFQVREFSLSTWRKMQKCDQLWFCRRVCKISLLRGSIITSTRFLCSSCFTGLFIFNDKHTTSLRQSKSLWRFWIFVSAWKSVDEGCVSTFNYSIVCIISNKKTSIGENDTGRRVLWIYRRSCWTMLRATWTPLAEACDRECVIPLPSPMMYSPLYLDSSFSLTSTSML